MAGVKQHHIPQSLQRGFLFDVKGEKTYVHRRGGSTFPASIKDVAAQRYFYSRMSSDGSRTLDDAITEYESELGNLLMKLRAVPTDGAVDAEVAAEVVAHLTPRSANMRRIFGSGMKQLMTAAAEAFSDGDTVERILGLAEPEPNRTWDENVMRILDEEPQFKTLRELLPIPKSLLDRVVFMAAKEHFVGSFDAQSLGIAEVFTSLLDRLDHIVRESHNKALGKGLIAESRKASLATLEWQICAAPSEGAILPDCVALGVDEEEGSFLPYMMTDIATVSTVVMPITSEKLLIGTRPGCATTNLTNFNHDAVACSDEFFITASRAPIFAELGAKIGERWNSEIDTIVQDALINVFPDKKLSNKNSGEFPPSLPLGYQLSFTGLLPEEEVEPISNATQRLVANVRLLFNLERFDGITFTSDFQSALADLERGFDINTTPEWMPDYIAQGVATALVVRDGLVKVRIVMHTTYGQALVADEQQDAEVALHFLVAGLAQASTLKQIEMAVPDFQLAPVMMNDHDNVLHCAVRKSIRAYRYARDSAQFGAEEVVEQEFSKYLIGAFNDASARIAKAKEEHAACANFPRLFEVTHGAASDMLIGVARLLGHHHGVGKLEFPASETEVGTIMAARQLTSWIKVFSKDLQRFWQKASWTLDDFYALNIHAERVLWAYGIVLWREPNGQGTMVMAAPQT